MTTVKVSATVGFAALIGAAELGDEMQFCTRRYGAAILGVSRQRVAQLVQCGELAEITWYGERFLSIRSLRELQRRRANEKADRNG